MLKTVKRNISAAKSDATFIIDMLHDPPHLTHSLFSLIRDCRSILSRFEATRVSNICREAHFCLDVLAKEEKLHPPPFYFLLLPSCVGHLIVDDALGTFYDRLVFNLTL